MRMIPYLVPLQTAIPPNIMENMFRLADIIPSPNPLRGGHTGQSLAHVYEQILGQLSFRTEDAIKQKMKEVIDYNLTDGTCIVAI